MKVTALLVSHNGARWLPAVLAGLEAQSRPVDRAVAVDTGSTDASVSLLGEALGVDAVSSAPEHTSYGAAVRAGLDSIGSADTDRESEWIWLLHDDSAPAPDVLETLIDAARENPSASILGPKHREWPSLRRLLEVGVTISGTGRRETGLERGEYDQGQHDNKRQVLAVNTAGMLVRRDVLEDLGGFDPRLPLFGNDIDFGWRAARAGHRTLVVPEAVVFHVEAAHRGVRRTPVTTQHFRRGERQAALYTLLANCSLPALPFLVVRLFFGSLIRALGLLLVRAPGEAFDELVALARAYLRPDRIVAGRAQRRKTATVSAGEVRHLLAPPWLPYRHGVDFVGDIAAAVAMQAGEVSDRRRRRIGEAETGPVAAEAQNLPADVGFIARLVTSPVAAVFAVLTVVALLATGGALGSGMLSGGALLPPPDGASVWWKVYLESWHTVGTGSAAPAAPYILPLALAGTLLLGKAWLVVDLIFFLVVPLSAWGAYRFFRAIGGARLPALWGAVAYGLLPVLGGAVNEGRLGTVVAALVLPWLARSALFLTPEHSTDRRWRAAWRTALWLALLSAFVPVAWLLAVAIAFVTVVVALIAGSQGWDRPTVWGPLAVALVVVPVLLLPWSVLVFTSGGGLPALLFEAGMADPSLAASALSGWDLVTGRPGDVGAAPGWISLGVALGAVAALLRADSRRSVLRAWVVIVIALVLAALLAGRPFPLPQVVGDIPLWSGFLVLVLQAGAVTAAMLAANGIAADFSGSSFSWRQPAALVVVVAAVLSPLAGLVWWAATGISEPLDRRAVAPVPTYMTEAAEVDLDNGVLVLRGDRSGGFDYTVLRGDGARIGDDSVAPRVDSQGSLVSVITSLATAGQPEDIAALSRHGIEFIYLPAPADAVLAGNLDSVSGLTSASAVRPNARAWQLEAEPSSAALPDPPGSARPWLLALQGVVLAVVAVLAAPSRRERR